MIVIDRNAVRMLELAWLLALLAELGHERASIIISIIIAREHLHPMAVMLNDEQETSMMVERQADRYEEHTIRIAVLLEADRELESRIIIIKTIVSHISPSMQSNYSHAHTQRQRYAPAKSHNRSITAMMFTSSERERVGLRTRGMREGSSVPSLLARSHTLSHSHTYLTHSISQALTTATPFPNHPRITK